MVRWAAFRVNSCQASNRMCASLHQYLQLLSSFQLVTGKAASGHPVWKPLLTYCVTRWALNCPCSHQRQTMRIGKGTARPLSTSWQEGRHPLQSINFFSDTNLTILVPQGFCRWRDYCRWYSVGWSVWCRGWPDSQKPLCSRVYPYWRYSGNCTVPYCNLDSVFSRAQISSASILFESSFLQALLDKIEFLPIKCRIQQAARIYRLYNGWQKGELTKNLADQVYLLGFSFSEIKSL